MAEQGSEQPLQPEVVDSSDGEQDEGPTILDGSKMIRIASMTRAMLEEVRQAPLDEAGRQRLLEIHDRSLEELRSVLSEDLQEEFSEMFIPLSEDRAPSESELRLAQAQLVGWLEGLFHGIQASIASQQLAARAQLQQMQTRRALESGSKEGDEDYPGVYL